MQNHLTIRVLKLYLFEKAEHDQSEDRLNVAFERIIFSKLRLKIPLQPPLYEVG